MKADRGNCRYCGRPVLWVNSRGGKRMPLDERPDARGNVVVQNSGPALVYKTANDAYKAFPTLHRFTSHHMTCPQKRLGGVA